MSKKRILFLTRLYLPHIGGVETHIHHLSQRLLGEYEITVIAERDSSTELKEQILEGVRVYRITLPKNQTNKFTIWKWVFSHISLFLQSDIIHIHDVFFWILPLYPVLKLTGKKIYITFHGYEGTQNPTSKQKFWHQLAALLCDGNICIGGFHQQWYGVKPTLVSFGAVQPFAKQKNKRKLENQIKFLYVGRLSADTGILSYLQALKELKPTYNLTLDVYGDGPQREAAETYVKHEKLSVHFHGFIPSQDIPWQTYDVAFVSRYLAILESFLVGLPVVAQYNVEIKRDYLCLSPFKNWIIAAHTPHEIAKGISQVLSAEFQSNIRAAQGWSHTQTWEKLCQTYIKLWDNT